MANHAYAVAITEDNLRGVILSEAGPGFDLDLALDWLKEYEEGWFLRDEESALDCQFMVPSIFKELYKFISSDNDSLFRQVIRIK